MWTHLVPGGTFWGWFDAVYPNLAANVVWLSPAFIAHHVLLRRHINRKHDALTDQRKA